MGSRIDRQLALLLTGEDRSWSSTVDKANRKTKSLGDVGAKAGKNMARNLERAAVVGAVAAGGAITYVIDKAMELESTSASVAKTVGDGWEAIVAANKELASEIPVSVNELNEISAAAGAMGVARSGIDEFTKTVALLAETADDVDTAMGAEYLGHLRTNLKLTDAQILQTGDYVTHLGNNTASTEGDILAMAENVSGAASAVNASIGDVMAWSAAMASAGEEAEAGGSAIQRVWISSAKMVNAGGKELKLLAKISGQSVAEFKKAYAKDAPRTLAKFITQLGKLSKAEQLATLEALGWNDIRITRAMLKMLGNTENLTGAYEQLNGAEGAMAREAAIRFETTAAQLDIFRNNVDLAAASIGSKLLPIVNELAKDAVGWIQAHEGDIEQFGEDLAGGIRDAVTWAKSLDWDAIGAALQTGAAGAQAIAAVFAGMPPWVQQAVLTGWGLNKLTGGAVVDLGKIAFDQFAGRGASPANPVWVAQVGGGKGGSPGGGGGGGGGSKGGGRTPGPGGGGGRVSTTGLIAAAAVAAAVIKGDTPQDRMAPTEYEAMLGRMLAQGRGNEAINGLGVTVREELRRLGSKLVPAPYSQDNDPNKRGWRNEKAAQAELERITHMVDASKDDTVTATKVASTKMTTAQAETKRETARGLAVTAAATRSTEIAARQAGLTTAVAMGLAATRIVAAVRAIPQPVISPVVIERTTSTLSRSGDPNASRHE